MSSSVVIGSDVEIGAPVSIDAIGRRQSTYVIGITGTGKSTLLESIAYHDMENGDGLCFLDPHGDSTEKLLRCVPDHRLDDVIYWDPRNTTRAFGLNPFSCVDPADGTAVSRVADHFLEALSSLKDFVEAFRNAPHMSNMLRQLAVAFVANPGRTLVEAPEFLTNAGFRRQFYGTLLPDHWPVHRFWETFDEKPEREQREAAASSLNKLYPFQTVPVMRCIFGQPTNSIDFRGAMDNRKIVLVKLSEGELGPDTAGFIGAFVVYNILQAALSRADTPESERQPFHLIADEFQTFMTTAFPKLLAQARKYAVDTVVAHQSREQLGDEVKDLTRAVGNLVVFRTTSPNATALAGEFDTTPPEPEPAGLRQRYNYAPSPLDHLAQHGHEDPKVIDAYRELLVGCDKCFEFTEPVFGRGYEAEYETERRENIVRFYRSVNMFIYNKMRMWTPGVIIDDSHRYEIEHEAVEFIHDPFDQVIKRERFGFAKIHNYEEGLRYLRSIGWRSDELMAWDNHFMRVADFARREKQRRMYFGDLTYSNGRGLHSRMHLAGVGKSDNLWIGAPEEYVSFEDFLQTLTPPNGYAQWLRFGDTYGPEAHELWIEEELQALRELQPRVETLFPPQVKPTPIGTSNYSDRWYVVPDGLIPDGLIMRWPGEVDYQTGLFHRGGYHNLKGTFSIVEWRCYIACRISNLTCLLMQNPCYVASGQLEPIPDKPRMYTDVAAEIANQITNLPNYTAKCKLSYPEGPREVVIRTVPIEDRHVDDPDLTAALRIRSADIGRSCREVDSEIARRLGVPTGIMNDSKHKHEDDNEPVFGERAAAQNTPRS